MTQKLFDLESHFAFTDTIPPANTEAIQRKTLNVAYADRSPQQKLDIYLPEEATGPYPVIVSIHGGAFMVGDKAGYQLMPMLEGLKRGYAVVSINYRMSWEVLFPALVQDAKAAVRWIRANAAQYNFDRDKIAAWGGSAGGYLAAMLGTTAHVAELDDLSLGNPEETSRVQAVVDWFGPTNFLLIDEELSEIGLAPPPERIHSGENSPESLLLGAKITDIPEIVNAANPITYVQPDVPPFFIQHGDRDPTVSFQQSVALANKIEQVAGKSRVTLELLAGVGHGGAEFETPHNIKKILDFLDQHLC